MRSCVPHLYPSVCLALAPNYISVSTQGLCSKQQFVSIPTLSFTLIYIFIKRLAFRLELEIRETNAVGVLLGQLTRHLFLLLFCFPIDGTCFFLCLDLLLPSLFLLESTNSKLQPKPIQIAGLLQLSFSQSNFTTRKLHNKSSYREHIRDISPRLQNLFL